MSVNNVESMTGVVSGLEIYRWFLLKEREILRVLNALRRKDKLFVGLFWCPTTKIESVH
jgi:hypothetical protein